MEHNSIFDHQMSFSAFFFKGLGWATLGVGQVQNSIITTGVIISEPDKKNLVNLFSRFLNKRLHVHFGLS